MPVPQGDKVMDHAKYQRDLKTKSVESLRYIIKDAREAIQANPNNPNNGYYADEVHYAHAELRRRNLPKFTKRLKDVKRPVDEE